MKNGIVIFLIATVIGFGVGYLFDQNETPAKIETSEEAPTNPTPAENVDNTTSVPAEAQIFSTKGCIACHAISDLGVKGGATGPDLSNAYNQVEGKHGKPLNEFLKEPTSAVMSGVIAGNPLTDDEIKKIIEALKLAAESK
ncbi:MAG: c-type cytochrome [Paenibacillaceae bacterium]